VNSNSVSKIEKNLDKLDRHILFELDCNSRISLSELAKKLRNGRDTVEYRVNRLIERKIIRSFTLAINHYRLGLQIYKTYLRLAFERPQLSRFIDRLKKHPQVYWIAECDGQWDLIFSIVAKNLYEFHQLQDEILSSIAASVLEFDVFPLVKCLMYRKGYFLNKVRAPFIVGGEPADESIDRLDSFLMQKLSYNSRASLAELARELNVTPHTVSERIKKLEDRGIIIGYRIEIDLRALHMTFFKAQIYLRDYSANCQQKLESYCQENPNITYLIQQLGRCKLEIEIEADGYHHYSKIVDDIREKFSHMIRSIVTNVVRRENFKWVPNFY
jgi:DNA-binding Lrp family transcriptional regulator